MCEEMEQKEERPFPSVQDPEEPLLHRGSDHRLAIVSSGETQQLIVLYPLDSLRDMVQIPKY